MMIRKYYEQLITTTKKKKDLNQNLYIFLMAHDQLFSHLFPKFNFCYEKLKNQRKKRRI